MITAETNIISEIGGNDILAFIDPGSSDSIMKESVVEKFEFCFNKQENEIEGFGGGKAYSKGITRQDVKVDNCESKNVLFRVVNDIGRNYTELPELAFYRYGDKFDIISSEKFPFSHFPELSVSRKPVVKESILLPPASINFIEVKINDSNEILPVKNYSNNVVKTWHTLNSDGHYRKAGDTATLFETVYYKY